MYFKHPELLYALFLLIIPVLVHLFQLRKFRKEKFTNVKFLKKASLQTRKSSRIKKWLILCTRLLLLTAIIIAFARPYIPSGEKNIDPSEKETVIYLDNSYSMQARGQAGILLRRSIQELLENLPEEGSLSFFTNDREFRNISTEALRNELQQISFTPQKTDWQNIQLKAGNLFSEKGQHEKNFIAISDFQIAEDAVALEASEVYHTSLVQLKPENVRNIGIDTAFIENSSLDETSLSIRIRGTGVASAQVPVSLYNDQDLIAKKTIALQEDLSATTSFVLPSNEEIKGRISIEDPALSFDNDLYFSINKEDPIAVVAINDQEDSYLRRIFSQPEFSFKSFSAAEVDFNVLSEANLIILNEMTRITSPLSSTLQNLQQQGLYLIVIPAAEADLDNYNDFFDEVGLPRFTERTDRERLITRISFGHPLYEGVFDEQVENFQYPHVELSYELSQPQVPVLSYEDGGAFLYQAGNSFVFTAPLNLQFSNFQRAPLIVPSLYNIGNFALRPSQLYYSLGEQQQVDINVSLAKDEILQVTSGERVFIPRQQTFQNKVQLTFMDTPEEPGHYSVMKDSTRLQALAFNSDSKEGVLRYHDPEPSQNMQVYNEISEVFQLLETRNNTQELWKWFVIFALILLLTEMLILKYFK